MLKLSDTVLQGSGVGKIFSRSQAEARQRIGSTLRQAIFGPAAASCDLRQREFWALKDIDLKLVRGESLGIIGLNGSGKTTLLRILAGQIVPDAGFVRVWGRTASMIDLTAGFQTFNSGRRNIYLRGAALGRSHAAMAAAEASIIEFAELGDAIDAPVATYSSGMTMRLAFAIMVASTPDILFIDEVLAVGDFRFRQKCLAKLREIRERTSFVMVSHSMADVARFCDRVCVIHKGRKIFDGEPNKAIEIFHNLDRNDPAETNGGRSAIIPATVERPDLLSGFSFDWLGPDGVSNGPLEISAGAPIGMRVSFRLSYKPKNLVVGIPFYDHEGTVLTGFATDAEARGID
ncbi:MAG: ABC transporter ATP-binding protein, partial [Hyphomicrobium sp.]